MRKYTIIEAAAGRGKVQGPHYRKNVLTAVSILSLTVQTSERIWTYRQGDGWHIPSSLVQRDFRSPKTSNNNNKRPKKDNLFIHFICNEAVKQIQIVAGQLV